MSNDTILCADIAKHVFQVVMFRGSRQVSANKAYTRTQFEALIHTKSSHCIWVMEACGGAQHWGRLIRAQGQRVVLLSPRFVAKFRQGQKTDANDALAMYDAYRSHQMKPCPLKTVAQQGLQTLERTRQHYQHRKVRLSNAIRGHLTEFGIIFSKGYKQLKRHVPMVLEDAHNGLPHSARVALACYWDDWQQAVTRVNDLTRQIEQVLSGMASAKQLRRLEGVGPVCASGLICALGDGGEIQSAKQAAAFVGTAPKVHASGSKHTVLGICKKSGHKRLRAALIQGARSVIIRVNKLDRPCRDGEVWLAQLIERVGENRAAVALANKNVRRAYAILRQHAQPQTS